MRLSPHFSRGQAFGKLFTLKKEKKKGVTFCVGVLTVKLVPSHFYLCSRTFLRDDLCVTPTRDAYSADCAN